MDEAIIRRLQDVGMALYEARVYLALLRHGAQNGNELAKNAGVPSSKVYSTLEKLALEGIVSSSRRGSTNVFSPVAPEELVQRLRRRFNDPLDYLGEALPQLRRFEPAEPVLSIAGRTAVIRATLAIIGEASHDVHVSCWSEDLPDLREAFTAAVGRGVAVWGMLYGKAEPPPGTWLHHSYEDIVEGRIDGRLLTLVADDGEALIARLPHSSEASGVRTRNQALTLIVKEYLHHDFVLQRAQIQIGFDQWDEWWQADPGLRTVILDGTLNPGGGSAGRLSDDGLRPAAEPAAP